MRGPDGFCVKCEPGEIGEAVSKIMNDPKRPSQRFEGYADPEQRRRRSCATCLRERRPLVPHRRPDASKDAAGYYYFVDRIGDTFRWKGENVATSEVQEAVTVFPGVKEANVYRRARAGRGGPRRHGGAGR